MKILLLVLVLNLFTICTSAASASNLEAEFGRVTNPALVRSTVIDKFMGVGRFEKVASLANKNENHLRDQHLFLQEISALYLLGQHTNMEKVCRRWLEANRDASKEDVQFVNDFIEASKGDNQNNNSKKIKADLRLFLIRSAGVPIYELEDNSQNKKNKIATLSKDATALENLGKFGEAADCYRKALTISNADYLLIARLALCEFTSVMNEQGTKQEHNAELARISDDFKKSVSLNRKDWRTINAYAAINYMRSLSDAKPFIEEAIAAPGVPESQVIALRDALGACNVVPDAEKIIRETYKLPPVKPRSK